MEQVVLAIVAEEPMHGFAIASTIAADEALSLAIRVRRPLVYRSLEVLAGQELVKVKTIERGSRGSQRRVYHVTGRGRRVSLAWLNSVVSHPRDARLDLLAKVVLRLRSGLGITEFATAQRVEFEKVASGLSRVPDGEGAAAAFVRRWRYENVVAMVRLLEDAASGSHGGGAAGE